MAIVLKDRKSVYHSSEIPHLWAHGLPDGRKIRNGSSNIYAEGDTIYSYGAHFPIARRVTLTPDRVGGLVCYLYTTRRYSVTTRGHCYTVERAMQGNGRVFHIDPTDGAGNDLWAPLTGKGSARPVAAWFQSLIDAEAKSAAAPRIRPATRAKHMARVAHLIAEWREVHSTFRLRLSVDTVRTPGTVDEIRAKYAGEFAALERTRKEEAERTRLADEAREREEAERERVAATLIPAWRMGGEPRAKVEGSPDITIKDIRYPVLRIDGEEVETSWGARVPVDEARQALRILPRLIGRIASGETSPADPTRIGHYSGVAAERTALRIGCHTIPYTEVAAFCGAAGWPIPAALADAISGNLPHPSAPTAAY